MQIHLYQWTKPVLERRTLDMVKFGQTDDQLGGMPTTDFRAPYTQGYHTFC